MTHKADEAVALFQKGFNCAQSVLGSFGPDTGLDRESCLRVGGSFGAGMARKAETCGAVTGGVDGDRPPPCHGDGRGRPS